VFPPRSDPSTSLLVISQLFGSFVCMGGGPEWHSRAPPPPLLASLPGPTKDALSAPPRNCSEVTGPLPRARLLAMYASRADFSKKTWASCLTFGMAPTLDFRPFCGPSQPRFPLMLAQRPTPEAPGATGAKRPRSNAASSWCPTSLRYTSRYRRCCRRYRHRRSRSTRRRRSRSLETFPRLWRSHTTNQA